MLKKWNWNMLFILLPVLSLILCFFPGTVQMEYVTEETTQTVSCAIAWGAPEDTTLYSCSFLFPVLLLYLGGAGVAYYKTEGDGIGKSLIVLSAVTVFFTLLPVIGDAKITLFPYLLLPAMQVANAIAAYVITNRKLRSKYEDPIEEILNRGR